MNKTRFNFKLIGLLTCLLAFGLAACVPNVKYANPAPPVGPAGEPVDWTRLPPPPAQKQLVAIAGFENKSTYSADRLWDTSGQFLASHLLRTGYFRVVEWEEMKRLFDWDTLSQADIVKSPANMQKARRILLCEYFISGSISRFNVSTHSQVSATSKARTIDTTVRVDLTMQDAQTGEYLATGRGEHTVRQTFSGNMAGGQVGSWDSSAGDEALDNAIAKALVSLIATFSGSRGSTPGGRVHQGASGVKLR